MGTSSTGSSVHLGTPDVGASQALVNLPLFHHKVQLEVGKQRMLNTMAYTQNMRNKYDK